MKKLLMWIILIPWGVMGMVGAAEMIGDKDTLIGLIVVGLVCAFLFASFWAGQYLWAVLENRVVGDKWWQP